MFTLENILSPPIVQKLGWTLLHFVWQGAVVAFLLAVLLRILRKCTASLRYIVACLALVVIVLMPMITFKLVPAPDPAPAVESMPIPARLSAAPQELYTTDLPLGRAAEYMQMSAPTSWKQRAVELFEPALPYVVLGWLIGVVVLAVWHLGGWAQLQRLKRRIINEVDGSLTGRVNELADSLGVKRAVRLLESAFVQVPTVVGWLRPVILLPASALTGLTAQQLEALLAHELAHIKRLDYLLNMLQTIVEIVGFYHPAVWWVSNRIRDERENCCDDLAVNTCGDTRQYVKALAQMEKIRSGDVELAIAASGGNLYRRVSRLLGKEVVRKNRPSWVPAALAAILLIALAIPAALAISGGNSRQTLSPTVSDPTPDTTTARMLPPAPDSLGITLEITAKPKIAVECECKVIEVPADSEFVKGKNPGDVIMWLDGEFTSRLEALIRATQGANVLTAPKVIVLDEEEAMMATGEQRPCITGYEEGADANGNPKPIINYVFCGLELKIKPNVVEPDAVHMDIHLSARSEPAAQKDAAGRTIHLTTSSDSTTEVTVNDGDTLIICGPKDVDRPDRNLVLQITPHITRPDEHIGIQRTAGTTDRLAAAKPTKAAEYPVMMVIKAADYAEAARAKPGQNPLGMAIRLVLDSIDQLTAAGTQIDDLAEVRRILSAQGFTIDAANFSGDKCSLVISKPIDDGIKGRLVCRLTKQNDSLLVDQMNFKSVEPVRPEPSGRRPLVPPTEALTPIEPTDKTQQADEVKQAHDNLLRELGYLVAGPQADEPRPPDEALLRARKYMHQEDAEQAKTQSDKETTVFPLKYGNAEKLAELLNQIVRGQKTTVMAKGDVQTPALGDEIRIVPNANSNLLIIQASQEDLRKIADLIAHYDVPTEETTPKTIVQIFKLKYADCEQASTILAPLLTSGRKVMITTNARSNQLIVQATAPDMQQIERLIAEIDVPAVETSPQGIELDIRPGPTETSSQDRRVVTTEQLGLLEGERQALLDKLQRHRQTFWQTAQEYGTADLTKHQEIKLQRVATLLDTLTKTEAHRMQLESELRLLEKTAEQTGTPQELLKMRQDYINADPTIKALAEKVAQVEMELLLARQTSTESSPEITKKANLLQALNKRLDELKYEVGRSFDELMAKETAKGKQQKLARLQAELQQLREYEKQLANLLNEQDAETKDLGRKQLELQDLQWQMDLDQQMYDTVRRRINELDNRAIGHPQTPAAPGATPMPSRSVPQE
jgi:beta-lactamase regulating signal transducer with metallopeptidase domain